MMKIVLLFSFFAFACLWAQDVPVPEAVAPPVVEAPSVEVPVVEVPPLPDDGVRVSILGYHDLSEHMPETAMRLRTSKFRKQMETIHQLGIKVVTLDDFTAWKKGEREIPAQSIVLTFDDGWKSVYTDAFPILKEFGFPFTIFLYKDYVDGGGKALTTEMIREMTSAGATIGSHSVSHPFPIVVKSFRKKGPAEFDAYLRKEMGVSKSFLEAKFSTKVTSYAYPGGFYTEEMPKMGEELGYSNLFTVLPGKIRRSSPNETLPRYIILGNHDKIFEIATRFGDGLNDGDVGGSIAGTITKTAYPVTPEAGAMINSRQPEIAADLSTVENLDPASLSMKVSGFGEVPATYAPETKKFSWRVNRSLRQTSCQVAITWKDTTGKVLDVPLRWLFKIDRESAYLPDGE